MQVGGSVLEALQDSADIDPICYQSSLNEV